MISRNGKGNFFAAHYEWVALGATAVVLALAAVKFVSSQSVDADEAAQEEKSQAEAKLKAAKDSGVKEADFAAFEEVMQRLRKPPMLKALPEKGENFLASELRIFCLNPECRAARLSDTNACPKCGFVPKTETKVEYDTDKDGLPNEWEERYGFNPKDASDADEDADGDGFTNAEEFAAKTDPRDKSSHPDYLDSLQVAGPLNETVLPFTFVKATQIPSGWRFYFRDPKRRNAYGKVGMEYSVLKGEQIGDTGWLVKDYERKFDKQRIKGGQGAEKTVDMSVVAIERKSDARALKLLVGDARPVAVDIQATLAYVRGTGKTYKVVVGDTIDVAGGKYLVAAIRKDKAGNVLVDLKDKVSGKVKTIGTLEQ